jgi:alpha-1,6-mannosyltransferase
MKVPLSRRWLLVACGCGLEAWALSAVADLPGADLPRHVLLILGACVFWVVALRLVLDLSSDGRRADLAMIFAFAVAIRVTFLFTPPSLSDDVYRAVWDARLMHAGINPYTYPPGAPELEPYRDEVIWPRVNHPEQRTPYPPLAELLSAAAYAMAPERLVAMQVLAALADLLGAGLLGWLLARCGMDPRRSLVLAWSPIGALHSAHSGHNDAIMVAAVVGGALLLTFGRGWLAMAALGVGTMVKATPVFMLPSFARSTGVVAATAWLATCVLLTLPLVSQIPGFVHGVLQEAGSEVFNDSVHLVVERVVGRVAPAQAGPAASLVALLAVGAAALASWVWSDGSPRAALVGGSRVLATYILVAAVVEPWYFTWLAPLVAFELRPVHGRPWFAPTDALAWLWLSVTANLTDLTYAPGGASLWVSIRIVEYAPAYLLLVAWVSRRWRERRGDSF